MTAAVALPRAGFWVRFGALFIDMVVIGAVLAILGIGLAKLTDGQVRVANSLIYSTSCVPADPVPDGASPPADFAPTKTLRCTRYLAGLVANDWYLAFVKDTHPGSRATPAETRKVPLDPAGRVTSPFYLDRIELLFLLAYWLAWETKSGASAGKKLLGQRVRSLEGGNPSLLQSAKRLLRIVLLAPFMSGSIEIHVPSFAYVPSLIIGLAWFVAAVAFLVNFIRATGRGDLPWHDRWASTEVVHAT
jgi:uncharacterized RDD family membrane protein YckC